MTSFLAMFFQRCWVIVLIIQINPSRAFFSTPTNWFDRRFTKRTLCQSKIDDNRGSSSTLIASIAPEEQWKGFKQFHCGTWAGVQTTHFHADEEESSQTERLFCGVQLLPSNDGDSINHTNFFVKSIPEPDAVVPAEQIAKQQVANYNLNTLTSKVCANVALGGPRSTNDGMSLQLSFRHENQRLRMMITFEASDFMVVPATSIQIPASMSLADIVISREQAVVSGKHRCSTPQQQNPNLTLTDSQPNLTLLLPMRPHRRIRS